MTATAPDEFDALRTITQTLETFGSEDQSRILRWAAEKLGLTIASRAVPPASTPLTAGTPIDPPRGIGPLDIKSFIAAKKPKNDTQFAAVVAYYYRFEAADKKESITKDDLLEACRLAVHPRPPAPGQTLRNAVNAGLLDNADRGAFSINSVGENLVAVTLPGDGVSGDTQPRRKRAAKAAPKKKAGKKVAAKKVVSKKK